MSPLPAAALVRRALQRAERILGLKELALRLRATEATVMAWRDGHASMPERKFLSLVDLLDEIDASWDSTRS